MNKLSIWNGKVRKKYYLWFLSLRKRQNVRIYNKKVQNLFKLFLSNETGMNGSLQMIRFSE